MTEKLHPVSNTHPSHRWFHTNEGQWRCACGVTPDLGLTCDLPCKVHSSIGAKYTGQREDRVEREHFGGLDVSATHRTEKERCEWAGVEYLESDYQESMWDHIDENPNEYFNATETATINHDLIMFAKNAHNNIANGSLPSTTVKRYHQTGGIVRHGCEARQ